MYRKLMIAALCGVAACGWARDRGNIDITTLNGSVYPNAYVQAVTANGIDIGYIDGQGTYVLKAIKFEDLPENLQKRFGHDPEKNRMFSERISYAAQTPVHQAAWEERTRLANLSNQIRERFEERDVALKPRDLRDAIYGNRVSVQLTEVAENAAGSVARVTDVVSDRNIDNELIQLHGIDLPAHGKWSGFIYPTGLSTRYRGRNIPVYASNLEDAANILHYHLNIYSEYESQGKPALSGDLLPPDLDPDIPPGVARSAINAGPDLSINEYYYNYNNPDPLYADGFYFLGSDYGPINWWGNDYWPNRYGNYHDSWNRYDRRDSYRDYGRRDHDRRDYDRRDYDRRDNRGRDYGRIEQRTPSHTVVNSNGFRQAKPHTENYSGPRGGGGGRGGRR